MVKGSPLNTDGLTIKEQDELARTIIQFNTQMHNSEIHWDRERAINHELEKIDKNIEILNAYLKENELFEPWEDLEPIDDTALFDACESEGISRVKTCIDMLGEAQRDVIVMYYLYHRSIKEIAKFFGISEVVAESRWNHGRVRLMQLLERRGIYVRREKDGQ